MREDIHIQGRGGVGKVLSHVDNIYNLEPVFKFALISIFVNIFFFSSVSFITQLE